MPHYEPPTDRASLTELVRPVAEPKSSPVAPVDAAVSIPVEDVVIPEYSDVVQNAIQERARLANDVNTTQEVWSRASEKHIGEGDRAHQERIKAEFEAAVMAVRRQDAQPPPPPQPIPPALAEQTRREMEAGRKQSEHWREQQKNRPMPNAKEIMAAGVNTPVFRPGEYMHEKGSVDKHLVVQQNQ